MGNGTDTVLNVKRVFDAPREKVFQAWTDPNILKEWFRTGNDWTTPVYEVDLQVGGSYRLGMQPPDSDTPYVACGTYREVKPPERLVFTWMWEGQELPETVITIEFRDVGNGTEVELTHERFPNRDLRDQHNEGWILCFEQLAKLIETV